MICGSDFLPALVPSLHAFVSYFLTPDHFHYSSLWVVFIKFGAPTPTLELLGQHTLVFAPIPSYPVGGCLICFAFLLSSATAQFFLYTYMVD